MHRSKSSCRPKQCIQKRRALALEVETEGAKRATKQNEDLWRIRALGRRHARGMGRSVFPYHWLELVAPGNSCFGCLKSQETRSCLRVKWYARSGDIEDILLDASAGDGGAKLFSTATCRPSLNAAISYAKIRLRKSICKSTVCEHASSVVSLLQDVSK